MSEFYIEQPMPPILLEPGLRLVGCGITDDGRGWLKFVNSGTGRIRVVHVFILAAQFTYAYAMRDPSTGTILAYEGPHGDPTKDESHIYGAPTPE